MTRGNRYTLFDGTLVSSFGPSTATITSSSIEVDYSNGYFAMEALHTSAATSNMEWYYEISNDDTHWQTALATAGSANASGSQYIIDGFDPPVCRYIRLKGIGTVDHAPSGTVSAWLTFTED